MACTASQKNRRPEIANLAPAAQKHVSEISAAGRTIGSLSRSRVCAHHPTSRDGRVVLRWRASAEESVRSCCACPFREMHCAWQEICVSDQRRQMLPTPDRPRDPLQHKLPSHSTWKQPHEKQLCSVTTRWPGTTRPSHRQAAPGSLERSPMAMIADHATFPRDA